MKLIKTSSGKKLTLSRKEWKDIGNKAGWITAKKSTQYDHSPTEEGFIDECISKNKDKGDPGAYCASIVDKAKGTTDWRKGPKSNTKNKLKIAQNLDVVKTPETFTDREVTRAIRDAIIAEEDAIKQYETVVDATNNEKVQETLQDIADEEKVHVGELQALLRLLLPDEQEKLEEGAKEVDTKEVEKS